MGKLFPYDHLHITNTQPGLFGGVDDSTTHSPTDSFTESINPDLYQLSDTKINRLINVKYNNNPINLIKQLSLELTQRNSELLHLQQQSFIKNQKLYKLLTDYASLSTLEIDKLLLKLSVRDDKDDEGTEVEEVKVEVKEDEEDEVKKNGMAVNVEEDQGIIDIKEQIQVDKLNETGTDMTQQHDVPSVHHASVLPRPSSLSMIPSWVKSITRFNSEDELNKKVGRPHSKSSPLDNSLFMKRKQISNDKLPLELEKLTNYYHPIDQTEAPALDSVIDNQPVSENIDKYGFYINSSSIKVPQTSSGSNQAILINNRKSYLQSIGQLIEISKIHDSNTLNYENQWDMLFKDINRNYYKKNDNKTGELVDTITSPEKFGLNGLNLLYGSHDFYLQLIQLIHKNGIPENYRYELWLELSGAKNLRVNGEYIQLVKDINNYLAINDEIIQTNINQINLDISRTFKTNWYFNNQINCQPGPHYYRLERILYAFVAYKPKIGYYQGMNKIVGNLLILMSYHNQHTSNNDSTIFTEEDIFWIFIGLIEEILPRYDTISFFNGLLNIRLDQIITHKIYLKKYLPNLCSHIDKLGIQFELITMNWWLTLFIDLRFINLETWYKIFDVLIIDDSIKYQDIHDWKDFSSNYVDNDNRKALKLISITLAILNCLEQFLLSLNDNSSIYRYLDGNNTSKFYDDKDQEIKIHLKFSDIMLHYQDYLKKIDIHELILHRSTHEKEGF